ncbi:YetF domain-containing protein [Siminovitchia sediminis]|uniref:YetF domain-containing protein n=1 Tax=Siminovitchia sediminis TaxID=1274353 RepID=A0ABW4KF68_9BACI
MAGKVFFLLNKMQSYVRLCFITLHFYFALHTRLMGRKEISQMTFFNFVSAISLGTLGASFAIDSSISITNGFLALAAWSAFTIFIGILDIKFPKFRSAIEGQPRILIKKGQIMENELRKVRLDIDALHALLRKKNVFSVSDVEYAIFEIDGTLSVMKKEPKQAVTKSDMKINQTTVDVFPISTSVISDGKIKQVNLEKLNLDQQWLERQLKLSGVQSVSEVFYAEIQKDGTLYIDLYNDVLH